MTDFSADWLSDWLSKHNSITTKVMGLISSLFNIASSRNVPFCQPLQLQCLHHGSTKAYLCSPFLSSLLCRWWFAVAPLCGFMEDVVTVVYNMLSFCLKRSVRQHWKQSVIALSPFHCDLLILRVHAVMSRFSIFPYRGKKRYFSYSPLSILLCNRANIHEFKAYWQINFQ